MKASSFLLRQGSISSTLTVILLLLSLFFVNWQINILGIEQYGLLVLVLSVFGTMNIINIGVGTAIVDYYSKYGDDKSVFWSIFIVSFLVIFFISMLIIGISSVFYKSIFNILGIEEKLNLKAFYGFAFIGISRLLGTITSSYWSAKVDFLMLKLFGFVNVYFSIAMILFFYLYGFSLDDSSFYAGVLNLIFIFFITIGILISSTRIYGLQITLNIKTHFKGFLYNGLQFQGLSIINDLYNPIINVLINTNLGFQAVSLFDIALKLLRAGRQVIVSATEPFFGKMTQLHNKEKKHLMRLLVLKYTKYMMIIAVIYTCITILLSKYILTLWMGAEIAQKTYITVNIISVGFAINMVASIVYYKYMAISVFRKYVFYHQVLILPFVTLPFIIGIGKIEEYAIYYSVAFAISSIYLLSVFYKIRRL